MVCTLEALPRAPCRTPIGTVSIDVCTPAAFAGDAWTFVDLELDVYRAGDGAIEVFDEDELEEAVASGGLVSEEEHPDRAGRGLVDGVLHLPRRPGGLPLGCESGDDPVFDGITWSLAVDGRGSGRLSIWRAPLADYL